ALEHFDVRSTNVMYVGTLGKAAGVAGAFVAAHETVVEWLVQRARSYIYTTASPPALAHALLKSLEIIEGAEGVSRRAHLRGLIARFQQGFSAAPWLRMPSDTAIQPVVIGNNADALAVGAALQAEQLWVPVIRPPTVPPATARLRITLSAAHTA